MKKEEEKVERGEEIEERREKVGEVVERKE